MSEIEKKTGTGAAPVIKSNNTDLADPALSITDDSSLYGYDRDDAPEDVVINAGNTPVIIAGEAVLGSQSPRMDPGERRRGSYYIDTIMRAHSGIQLVSNVPQKRLNELEKKRLIAIGALPPDWVAKARRRQEQDGDNFSDSELDQKQAAKALRKAMLGVGQ